MQAAGVAGVEKITRPHFWSQSETVVVGTLHAEVRCPGVYVWCVLCARVCVCACVCGGGGERERERVVVL